MCGFCHVLLCVCVGFVMKIFCMCGFCNGFVFVYFGFVICGCVYVLVL